MSDSGDISDLDKNRALADWLEWQLRRTRNRIRELEVKERQEQRAHERAQAEQSWKIQPKRSRDTATLHRGGCSLSPQLGFINREEAIIALNEPGIEACRVCHPETGLRAA
ncbi:DUF6233 domain-containing protein [Streptomyces sp. NBC_01724]|nr:MULTISPECIES: DUF6233 domain-containing protein [unclassified Streptomyces]WNO69191.1 DUF6233 domain-containing protein [Streptomyces sp. AM2-3-1]WSC73975.1 DUF6233 domain-containing protein [Streptomyces sp. NBC_01760]WTE56357.1 DUF6233 domain-containing protein [Streptomyces sp. NBC_01620]WTE64427.1 DUF6233 domain-containing protein [Streptomyces sp. NBC_01617]